MTDGITVAQYDRLITAIYEAAYNWSKWPTFLEVLSECIDRAYLALDGYDLRAGLNTGSLAHSYDEPHLRSYEAYYAQRNLWLANRLANPAALPLGKAVAAEEILDRDILLKSEFYADWLRPQENIVTGGCILLHRKADRMVVLSANIRFRDPPDKHAAILKALDLIGPHLQRSFEIARQLRRGDIAQDDYQHALDANPNAVLLVDAQARVHYANRAGRELLRQSPALSQSRNGRLFINDMDARARVESALGDIATRHWNGLNGTITCGVAGNTFPLHIMVSPLLAQENRAVFLPDLLFGERPIALITIRDPGRQRRLRTDVLKSRFGLTEAECELALHLVRGGSIADYAERRGRSKFTIRNQLQSVLEKTRTHRQAELTALIGRLAI